MAMNSYSNYYANTVKQLIQARIMSVAETIVLGHLSFEQYKYESGKLSGLRNALECFEEAETQMQKDDRASPLRDR